MKGMKFSVKIAPNQYNAVNEIIVIGFLFMRKTL